ncbi:histidine kinase [Nonlabens sp. Asnod2-A12]|uniref:tetratricopeptide repeat-containing sensor histidine kinase n=1 Tax=Nonlabens sp. Asnod2-A12 TaxID=3160578 RepID=UPI00386D48C9
MRFFSIFFLIICLSSCDKKNSTSSNQNLDALDNDSISISEKYYKEGLEYYDNGDLEKAKEFYKLAIDSCKTNDVDTQFRYYTNLMGLYKFKNEYGNAISILKKFKEQDLLPKDRFNEMVVNTEQHLYLASGQLEYALKANENYLKLAYKSGDNNAMVTALIFKKDILNGLGLKQKANDLIKELEFYDGLDSLEQRYVYTELGIQNFYNNDFKKAISYYNKSLLLAKESKLDGKYSEIATQYANIAESYIELKEFDIAKKYLDSFRNLNQQKVENDLRISVFKYELRLAEGLNVSNERVEKLIDKINKDQQESYRIKFNKELELLTDEKEISEELLKANQQAELDKLEFRNIFIISASALILIILIALFLIFKQKRDHEIKNLKFQQRLLRSQMNPHFIFNVLSSVQNLIRINPDLAPKFITKFSRLLRRVLENSSQNYVSIMDEVEVIENYLDLQKLRFPELFRYELNIDQELRNDMIHIPPMLIQPFIENAVEHGFKGIDYQGVIIMDLKLKKSSKKDFLQCVISDNGVGYLEKNNKIKKSMSIKLISDFINKSTGKEIKISFLDKFKNSGTIIEFNIPSK